MAASHTSSKHHSAHHIVNGYHDADHDSALNHPHQPPSKTDSLLSLLDRIISPSSRAALRNSVSEFATSRPILTSFIAAQLLFSTIPLLVFLAFTLSALVAFLTTAVLAALGLAGIGLLFLVPTLLLTTSLAVLAWAWAAGTFFVARWVYKRAVDLWDAGAGPAATEKTE